jgi:hypothetical protein
MEVEADEKELKAAGAEPLPDGRRGLRIHGWEIESRKRSILTSSNFVLSVKNLSKKSQIPISYRLHMNLRVFQFLFQFGVT